MTEQEALRIIKEEKLEHVNWYDDKHLRENQVVIRKCDEGWEVYVTDERAGLLDGTERKYSNSEDAYDALIDKARYMEEFLSLWT